MDVYNNQFSLFSLKKKKKKKKERAKGLCSSYPFSTRLLLRLLLGAEYFAFTLKCKQGICFETQLHNVTPMS